MHNLGKYPVCLLYRLSFSILLPVGPIHLFLLAPPQSFVTLLTTESLQQGPTAATVGQYSARAHSSSFVSSIQASLDLPSALLLPAHMSCPTPNTSLHFLGISLWAMMQKCPSSFLPPTRYSLSQSYSQSYSTHLSASLSFLNFLGQNLRTNLPEIYILLTASQPAGVKTGYHYIQLLIQKIVCVQKIQEDCRCDLREGVAVLGGLALLEEVHHWGWALKLCPRQMSQISPCKLQINIQDFDLLLSHVCLDSAMFLLIDDGLNL